jgi:hypothetical protein
MLTVSHHANIAVFTNEENSQMTTAQKLTPSQKQALDVLSQYAGERVLVLTSQYAVAPEAERISKGYFNAATLRGLDAKGLLKVETIWRGAWVTVPAKKEG